MKKIIAGVLALTLIISTVVFANNNKSTKRAPVSCSNGCPITTNCTPGTTCAVMPGCVCN